MSKTFIILAAGMGVRADSKSLNCPKVLLKATNGQSLLVNILEKIRQSHPAGTPVRVVAGFLHQQVVEEVNAYCALNPLARIDVVYNEIYERGVITSLYRGIRDVNSDVVILNGDTYYPDGLFSNLTGMMRSSLLVLPPDDQPDSVRVLTAGNWIAQVGKRLPVSQYISTGCLFLNRRYTRLTEGLLLDLIERDAFAGMIWHNLINLLIQKGKKIAFKLIDTGKIFEIDTKEDYQSFLQDMPNNTNESQGIF